MNRVGRGRSVGRCGVPSRCRGSSVTRDVFPSLSPLHVSAAGPKALAGRRGSELIFRHTQLSPVAARGTAVLCSAPLSAASRGPWRGFLAPPPRRVLQKSISESHERPTVSRIPASPQGRREQSAGQAWGPGRALEAPRAPPCALRGALPSLPASRLQVSAVPGAGRSRHLSAGDLLLFGTVKQPLQIAVIAFDAGGFAARVLKSRGMGNRRVNTVVRTL